MLISLIITGWVLAGILVLILALLLARMIVSIEKIKDPFGKTLIVGGAAIFSVQFIFNISTTIGLLPMTAMPLPFISYGLMPTILNSLIFGIFLSVYRRKDIVRYEASV
ncbi:FtsW/RodA/SpoVE family cell cycle protein [Bacillus sp. FJAT-49705]|uniref:FtsW/RodA/SpoVE family cell cycle protein n=1 Tax=Cytobacillus citreus TaxID=2833586 RepID=A0ABS5NX63_9BACI|nr:FtsW/RodA/SpoVE family cell cycle protein [Cytobacillus citreus]MBS4192425.1 FtsW/RodA/SpoVE family cell cycle protein [Cytobacillus citreus]